MAFTTRGPRYPSSGSIIFGRSADEERIAYAAASAFQPFPATEYLKTPLDPESTFPVFTDLPLSLSLDRVVKLLEAGCRRGGGEVEVGAGKDVSEAYAVSLDTTARDMRARVFTPGQRQHREKLAWRDEIWLAMWRAALVRAQVLARWEVVVTRSDVS